jgi:hypothetical protein
MLCLTRPDARRRHPAKALRYNPQRNSGLGAEYDYLYGPILVRFTGNLSPTKARDYEGPLG